MTFQSISSEEKLARRSAPIITRLATMPEPVMAEVGVFTARLSVLLLNKFPSLTLYAVDSWLGRDRHPESYRATGDYHANAAQSDVDGWRDEAMRKLRPFMEMQRVIVYHCPSLTAAELIRPESLDLVLIDADHSYEGVKADIAAWWPTVRPGGYLAGDDYAHPDPRFSFGVDQAVHEFAEGAGLPLETDGDSSYCKCWFVRKPVTSV